MHVANASCSASREPTILQATWENVLLANWFGLYNGGTAGVIWCTIAVWLLMLCMIASLAEMASLAPTAGGQKPLSYVVGWCYCLGWIAGVPSCCVQLAGMVETMILLMDPEADVSRLYQATLLLYCFLVLCIGFNIFCTQQLPLAEGILLFVHVLGFFVFLLVFWIMGDHAPAERVFREFHDGGGWGSTGLSCLVGLSTPIWCFIGPDAGAHMSEELKDASLQLPRAMMWAAVLNGILGVTMLISFCFCIQDIELLVNGESDFPIIEMLFNAASSRAATCVLGAMLVVCLFFSTVTTTASDSRQVWAFSRDQVFPFSKWIRFVSPGVDIPTNAILCVGLVCAVILRGEELLPARWSLGSNGGVINDISLTFLAVAFVFSFFPTDVIHGNTQWAESFNWAIVIFGATCLLALTYDTLGGRHRYISPASWVKQE
ncbi:hypothetical protein CERZMDRAFT_110431 [Cercospora zeae-maydis SCOH1-5]|uniref:Amino acid permease/ SLC12A domain-containing protein n=1 Tax=Cercospora zeae-maydis SCOH1-5 TaxID=717836 RepID=A0A6A6FN51_9PEZI|nr:hypothetical protein CERZMDRAFT_110431 [Cercospora zeae-maydis SCOH1-5]